MVKQQNTPNTRRRKSRVYYQEVNNTLKDVYKRQNEDKKKDMSEDKKEDKKKGRNSMEETPL